MPDKFEICSAALTRIGASPIASFTDDTVEAIVANENYEDTARYLLGLRRWGFASATFNLNKVDAEAPKPWDTVWELPSDLLTLRTIMYMGQSVQYQIFREKIFAGSYDALTAEYVWRVPENDWPPHFVELVTVKMQAIFALGVAAKSGLANSLEEKFFGMLAEAGSQDASQSSTRRIRRGIATRLR